MTDQQPTIPDQPIENPIVPKPPAESPEAKVLSDYKLKRLLEIAKEINALEDQIRQLVETKRLAVHRFNEIIRGAV